MGIGQTCPQRDLLCIGQEDWDEIWRRNQFLLAGLARSGATRHILFVERACDVTHGLRTRDLLRPGSDQRAKLAAALRGPRRCADAPGLWLLTPVKLLPNSVPPLRRINGWLERAQVRLAMRRLRMRPELFWTQNPEAAHWLAHLDAALTIYDATDDWSQMTVTAPRAWLERVRRGQEELAARSDLVLACSPALLAKWRPYNPNTHLVPNGVDAAHFDRTGAPPAPRDVAHLPRPVLGYTGTLHDDRIDLDLVRRIAVARPEWQLLFVGPDLLTPSSRSLLERLPNAHLLGPRRYRDLPAYMGAFDVCILPHRVNPFTESLNPIKLFEYLATGLPIVATPVATVRDVGDVIYLGGDPEQFVSRVEEALAEREEGLRLRRVALARAGSWEGRVAAVARLIGESGTYPRERPSRAPRRKQDV